MSCELRADTASDESFLWEMLYLAIFVPTGQPRYHGLYCVTRQLRAMLRIEAAIQV